jgi:hypothetical protein
MPITRKTDKKGSFYQFGDTGKRYYYKTKDDKSRNSAKKRAMKQGQAIEINKIENK